jgi:hypothetical protein
MYSSRARKKVSNVAGMFISIQLMFDAFPTTIENIMIGHTTNPSAAWFLVY